MAASFLIATLMIAGVLKLTRFDRAIYYRPFELLRVYDFKRDHSRYRKNVDLWTDKVRGNLQAMTEVQIARPRKVSFRTDEHGFRNDRGLQNQRYLLVGDSFIVGSGSSQEDIVSEQLYREYSVVCQQSSTHSNTLPARSFTPSGVAPEARDMTRATVLSQP